MKRLAAAALCAALIPLAAAHAASELDKEGMAVIHLAADEYRQIITDTPVISDRQLGRYLNTIANKLVPSGEVIPGGIRLDVTLLDKAMPEVYSTADGHIILTSGALFALQNEAQLAAVLSHEVAHLLGAHYPSIYQAFKEQERQQRSQALAAGIAGVVLGQAIDFATQYHTVDIYADASRGDISYEEANKRILAIEAGAGTLEGFSEVYQSLPPETKAGSGDPRLPLEMVADADGLKLLVRAGYDPTQAGEAWRRLRTAADKARRRDTGAMAMSFLPPQMRSLLRGVEGPLGGIRAEALTRSISQLPPDRPALLSSLARSREISALKGGRKLAVGKASFNNAVSGYLLADARKAYDAGDWRKARDLYQNAWDAGIQNADVAYALGQSQLGGFAFAATEREKELAEEYLLKAVKLNPKFADSYKALGELYGEWERYEEGIAMYRKYLKVAPRAKDRSRIERQISKLERKARR
jgi:tetratricopeptide (TPR) repeat protein